MVVHREGDEMDTIMDPFFDANIFWWYQDAIKRNWPLMTKLDGTKTYSCKFSELDLEAMKDFVTYSVIFDGKWYTRWIWSGKNGEFPIEKWVKSIEDFEKEIREMVVPFIKDDDVITILDYHN